MTNKTLSLEHLHFEANSPRNKFPHPPALQLHAEPFSCLRIQNQGVRNNTLQSIDLVSITYLKSR